MKTKTRFQAILAAALLVMAGCGGGNGKDDGGYGSQFADDMWAAHH
jgi:hypothetical protein